MNKLRCIIAGALAASVALSSAAALDFGGVVSNGSSLSVQEESDFLQENSLLLWVSSDFGTYFSFKAAASGTVRSQKPNFYADVDQFSLKGAFPNLERGPRLFAFEAGRFQESEFSGRILSHTVDGLRLEFAYPRSQIKAALGYTGLLNKEKSSLLLSREDAMDASDEDVYFAPPRLIGSLSWEFPDLFVRQTLKLSAIVQEDLRHLTQDLLEEGGETLDPSRGGRVDTQYLGVGLSGPLRSTLYYDAYAYLGTGRMLTFGEDSASTTAEAYKYEPMLSFLTGGSARYYLRDRFNSFLSAGFLFAGGDKDAKTYLEGNGEGSYTAFLPLSGRSNGLAFAPKSSNLLLVELSYSMKPLDTLQTSVGLVPYFKPAAGAMSEPTVDPEGSAGYLGTELSGSVNYRPFSDLGLGLSAGLFLPNGKAFLDGKDDPSLYAKLTFSFSF